MKSWWQNPKSECRSPEETRNPKPKNAARRTRSVHKPSLSPPSILLLAASFSVSPGNICLKPRSRSTRAIILLKERTGNLRLVFRVLMKTTSVIPLLFLAFSTLCRGQGTAFTYQGRLSDNGAPAGGIYDLRFTIYDALANGNAVSGIITNAATSVSNGLFTVVLDFGAGVFAGADRWLEIGVRTNSSGAFT
ncbi:MAG: hypothetical protein DME18_17535, partial [Verrucomicrobia bacterium]